MSKENKSEKEQVIAFLLDCLKNWYYFVISMVICTAIAVVYLKITTPVMKIAAKVSLREDDSPVGGSISKTSSLMSAFGMGGGGLNVVDESNKIVSHGYLKKMIRNLDLNKVYVQTKFFGLNKQDLYDQSPIVLSVEPALSDTTEIVEFKVKTKKDQTQVKVKWRNKVIGSYEIHSFPSTIETPIGKFTFSQSAWFDSYKKPFSLNITLTNHDFMSQIYSNILEADFEKKNSNLMDLNIINKNVPLGKRILNEIIHVYNQEWINDKNEVSNKTLAFIEERLDSVKLNLSQIDQTIRQFKDNHSLTDLEADVKYSFAIDAELQPKLMETATQLKLVDIIVDYVSNEDNKYELIPFSLATLDPSIAEVINQYNGELIKRSEVYRNSPLKTSGMSSLDEQLGIQRKNLLLSLNNIKKGMQITATDLKKKEDELNVRLGTIPVIERDYIALKREQEIQQTVYAFLLEKNYETAIKSVSLLPKLKVIDEPYALIKPVSPSKMKVAMMLLFFGAVFFPLSAIYLIPYIRDYSRARKRK
ncbi:MAG: hypothetical protein LBT25_04045 [Candidatus Symbiothrix sp.]|jgi:uncharacterized protein involved in exopolysaccharide biosynthesis|nr:hypothetical protein [Candidatus Symbiothrix sp.]